MNSSIIDHLKHHNWHLIYNAGDTSVNLQPEFLLPNAIILEPLTHHISPSVQLRPLPLTITQTENKLTEHICAYYALRIVLTNVGSYILS